MATPGTLRPLFPNVWRIVLLWEMGPPGFAESFLFHVSTLQIGNMAFWDLGKQKRLFLSYPLIFISLEGHLGGISSLDI